ncbi:DUF5937 family protein [Streptomyces sp. NPDC049954]|uniref:ArsR/SmtB family transcription factor n=1 Tax=Streptomyces sp. NPDC049954 TaxID=3155779 RepID=UPI003428EDD0
MTYRLLFGEADLLRCRFAVSPLWETAEAVRTLRRPDRFPYHPDRLERMRAAVEDLDLEPLWVLMPRRGFSPDFWSLAPSGPSVTIEEELARVRATDPDTARRDLEQALASAPGAARSAAGRALLADPARAVATLADLLERAWHALVAPDWPRLRALLDADVAHHARRLAEVGFGGLLSELDTRLSWHEGVLTVHGPGEHERVLGGMGLVLMPSVFAWPDVVSGLEAPWQPLVVYPARGIGALWEETARRPARALTGVLGRGRASVLAALGAPSTTSSLARRLGLAPSSVSAHLTALSAAGLLAPRRYGREVLYRRTALGTALAEGDSGEG